MRSLKENNPFKYSLGTRIKDKYFLEFLNPQKGEQILDVGCGLGYCTELFSKTSTIIWGIDLDAKSILFAKKYSGDKFLVGRGESLPFKNNTFDKILCSEVLEHVKNDSKVISEIYRVAKNGSIVVITAPALEGIFGSKIKKVCHGTDKEGERHYRDGYFAKSLADLLSDKGIRTLRVQYTMVFLTEIFMGLAKLSYALKNKNLESQVDLIPVSKSFMFKIYKRLFPWIFCLCLIENNLCKILKGHMIIVKGKVEKTC